AGWGRGLNIVSKGVVGNHSSLEAQISSSSGAAGGALKPKGSLQAATAARPSAPTIRRPAGLKRPSMLSYPLWSAARGRPPEPPLPGGAGRASRVEELDVLNCLVRDRSASSSAARLVT